MKRSQSSDSLDKVSKKPKLYIKNVDMLPCDICKTMCNYKFCLYPHVYCSEDCYDIILLRTLNNAQHQKFDDEEDLMLL